MTVNTRVRVEQHIAFGYSDEQIADRLTLPVELIKACRRQLDEINAEPPEPLRHGTPAVGNQARDRRRRNEPITTEAVQAIRRLTDAGVSAADIAARLRVSTRTVNRCRARTQAA